MSVARPDSFGPVPARGWDHCLLRDKSPPSFLGLLAASGLGTASGGELEIRVGAPPMTSPGPETTFASAGTTNSRSCAK